MMEPIKVLGLVGGISKGSLNKKLFNAVQTLAQKSVLLDTFDISELPFFSQDLEENPPKTVQNLKEKVKGSGAILFVTPEYNRSFPGVLKNALDWGSRPYGKSVWDMKPVGVMGASMGPIGTFGSQNHLRQVLACLNMPIMGQPEIYLNASKSFDESGNLVDDKAKELIQKYWKSFEAWILTCLKSNSTL